MIRVAIIAGVLHSGGKRNLIMEYYRHIDKTKVQYDFICDLTLTEYLKRRLRSWEAKSIWCRHISISFLISKLPIKF